MGKKQKKERKSIASQLRDEKKMTQEQVAEEIGITALTLGRFERGETKKPHYINKLALLYGVRIEYLTGEDTTYRTEEERIQDEARKRISLINEANKKEYDKAFCFYDFIIAMGWIKEMRMALQINNDSTKQLNYIDFSMNGKSYTVSRSILLDSILPEVKDFIDYQLYKHAEKISDFEDGMYSAENLPCSDHEIVFIRKEE